MYISTPEINSVTLDGLAVLKTEVPIKSKDFNIEVNGSACADTEITAKSVHVGVNG
ncbi:hypothetical protein KAH81_09300 [bacterium]|nr:hypothetical protein [bacterium]